MRTSWKWVVVAATLALAIGAVVVEATVDTPPVDGTQTSRGRVSCTAADRRSIVKALQQDYAGDVATRVAGLRCSATFAYGTVCVLCRTPPPGATFGVLLKRAGGGSWRYLGSGGPDVIERLASEAGLPPADLDELRSQP